MIFEIFFYQKIFRFCTIAGLCRQNIASILSSILYNPSMSLPPFWPYSLDLGCISKAQLSEVVQLCTHKFACDAGRIGDRWDFTCHSIAVVGGWTTAVEVFFKNQEDLVMFKLAYEPEHVI